MGQDSPLIDITNQMRSANVSQTLLVETWNGRNRALLKRVLQDDSTNQFKVALCCRRECEEELNDLLCQDQLAGIRMSTESIRLNGSFCETIARANKMLVVHAEAGIGLLSKELKRLLSVLPSLRVYVPHLAWPVQEGNSDLDWPEAIEELAAIPSITIGISAIQHFSSQPFPHDDVRDFALAVISKLPPSRIAMGTNYPLPDSASYSDYVKLPLRWIKSIHADWSFAI
jgi:predicted TIM-barrel fold metal-dependent hydrolase